MKTIKFLKNCHIECCIGFDDMEEPIFEEEKILKDEVFEVELLEASSIEDEFTQIQFGNGSVSFVNKKLFEIVD